MIAACDLFCIGIYSVDIENCECVPIKYMECHPQYNADCNQREYDISVGRDPSDNPYINDDWYPGAAAQEPECDLVCAAIYSFDPDTCACVEIEWMECHPQYGNDCNQAEYDDSKDRDLSKNPYIDEDWYSGTEASSASKLFISAMGFLFLAYAVSF